MPFGWQELLIVLVIVLIVFGAGKLSGVGTALGRSVREFRREAAEPEPGTDDTPAGTPATTSDNLNRDAAETR